jgi:hypothetical protein
MTTAPQRPWLLPCLLAALLPGLSASAQEDAPYAYPEDEVPEEQQTPRRNRPERGGRTPSSQDDTRYERMSRGDDPNTGLAFEALGGVMLLNSARAQFAEFAPAYGGRFTWELGRLFDDEVLHEALWLDVRYTGTGLQQGTRLIQSGSQLHYATIAPAYEVMFGPGSDYGLYAQAGGGIVYEMTTLNVGGEVTPINGLRSLIQAGGGLRGRTRLSSTSNLRLAWRLEAMYFRRGYLGDVFLGGSAGIAF